MGKIKFYAWLTGENALLLSQSSYLSHKKVMVMGTSMMVPVLIWLLNGFFLSYNLGELPWYIAILVGVFFAFAIFLIERIIIQSPPSKGMIFFRGFLAVLLGIIGSFLMDEVVFNSDIQPLINNMQKEYVKQSKDNAIQQFDQENRMAWRIDNLQLANAHTIERQEDFLKELDGESKSKKSGYKEIAKAKEVRLLESRLNENDLKDELAVLETKRENVIKQAELRANKDFSTKSFLLRMKAFFQLCSEDWRLIAAWIIFFLLANTLEIMNIVIKSCYPKTDYESRLELMEQMYLRRMQKILNNNKRLT
jgi:hypothetical protein